MDNSVPIDKAVAIPTFIGSLLSFLSTTVAILLHVVAPPKRHFRHALILNLLVADCVNSLNNTVSGGIFLSWGRTGSPETPATPSCVANAWIGQISVQTVDTTILIISVTVLSIVLKSTTPSKPPSLSRAILICVLAWMPGLITSNIGIGLGVYGQVSGNWCWIKPQYLGIRYGLTHGFRIVVFVATIAIYTFIYIRLKSTFNRFRISDSVAISNTSKTQRTTVESDSSRILGATTETELQDQPRHSSIDALPHSTTAKSNTDGPGACINHGKSSNFSHTTGSGMRSTASPNLKRMLLMNGYPIAYIILWIPGMANRLAESIDVSPRWLQALQASTQFVGLVNALTYGFNEQLRKRARERWKRRGFIRTSP